MPRLLKYLESQIEKELDRLDAYNGGHGIVCQASENLPLGWTMVYDGTCEVFGPAWEILAALRAVSYDPAEIVRIEEHPVQVSETECEVVDEPISALADCRGFELAWDALSQFSEDQPTLSGTWFSVAPDLIRVEQIEEGTPNDNPVALVRVETNEGMRWVCGPHGSDACALAEGYRFGAIYDTRAEALATAGRGALES